MEIFFIYSFITKEFKNTRNTFNYLIFNHIYIKRQSIENFLLDKISFLKFNHTKTIYIRIIYNSTIILGV